MHPSTSGFQEAAQEGQRNADTRRAIFPILLLCRSVFLISSLKSKNLSTMLSISDVANNLFFYFHLIALNYRSFKSENLIAYQKIR